MSPPATWKLNSTKHAFYLDAQRAARDMGLPFTIKLADLPIPPRCPALGLELIPGRPKRDPHKPCLILLDPARGYVPGNVRIVSAAAAALRGIAEPADLRAVADFIEREVEKQK
ncbi:MAG TPA: hypothetical protein VHT03_06365 [Rhizomicrobium sp.]|jgi:hypothetical protein|nr:hypothetical protein [Rhizomicrobium sp.]